MKYLERRQARASQKGSPHPLTELTKAPSVSFVSDQGDRFPKTRVAWNTATADEREALVIVDDDVPERFAKAFADPAGLPRGGDVHPVAPDRERRWPFLDQWGRKAEALGWTAPDLFGLDPPPLPCRVTTAWVCSGSSRARP